jgi:hypothetical protein
LCCRSTRKPFSLNTEKALQQKKMDPARTVQLSALHRSIKTAAQLRKVRERERESHLPCERERVPPTVRERERESHLP